MFSLINTDKISGWLGAPVHSWKSSEIQQIKNIQRCYKNAYSERTDDDDDVQIHKKNEDTMDLGDGEVMVRKEKGLRRQGEPMGADEDVVGDGKKDEEAYLPIDSPIRSKFGDKKAPANPTFKDYDAFKNSCSFDYWRNHFTKTAVDKFLSETAQTIVSNICQSQSKNQLRVHNGHIPLRKKREHITPLALVLHEIKLWSTHELRTMNVIHADTYQEIQRRAVYLESVSQKEVWGDASFFLAAGIRAVAADRMFRLFTSSKETLERARDYAFRGYNRRSSREKLQVVGELLKSFLLEEMKILSARMTLESKLSDPKTPRLQPGDFLNKMENQAFVDYKNFVNVMFFKLCQNPMVRGAITADYENPKVKEMLEELGDWSNQNLFCVPNEDSDAAEPDYKMDRKRELRFLPEVYQPTANYLREQIREVDPRAPVPDNGKRVLAKLKNAYESDEDVARIVKLVMKSAAAIQELVPTIYAIYQLWVLAGDGGDFTVYDTLREQVIRVMQNTTKRVQAIKNSNRNLNKAINELCERKEKEMEDEARKKRVRKYKPGWVMNQKFINIELMPYYKKVYKETLSRLYELAGDARDYDLSTDQLSDKILEAKKVFDAITGAESAPVEMPAAEEPEEKEKVQQKTEKKAYEDDEVYSDTTGWGRNNAFNDGKNSEAFEEDFKQQKKPYDPNEDSDSDW